MVSIWVWSVVLMFAVSIVLIIIYFFIRARKGAFFKSPDRPQSRKKTNTGPPMHLDFFSQLALIDRSKHHDLAVYAQFKNEGHILNEWLDHYVHEGVDHFYLVDNGSTDSYQIEPRFQSRATLLYNDKKHAQQEIGDQVYQTIRPLCKWLVVVDLDEFMYTCHYPSIHDYLVALKTSGSRATAIAVPWKIFGSSGHKTQPPSVVPHFLFRGSRHASTVKTIFQPSYYKTFHFHTPRQPIHEKYIAPPYFVYSFATSKDEWAPKDTIPSNVEIKEGELVLNHYATQSSQYFESVKMTRGDATSSDSIKDEAYFKRYDHNDVMDTGLATKRALKKNLHLVLNRFRESLSFIDENSELFAPFAHIHIYNKGRDDIRFQRSNIHIYTSENLGDGEESFLRFIIDHYEDDMTVLFASASFYNYPHPSKPDKFLFVLDRVLSTGDSMIVVESIPTDIAHFTLETHNFMFRQNRDPSQRTANQRLSQALIRPFGRWFKEVLQIPIEHMSHISYSGIFAASANDWRNRPLSFYRLLHARMMVSHPEEAHYIERAWAYILNLPPHKTLVWSPKLLHISHETASRLPKSGFRHNKNLQSFF